MKLAFVALLQAAFLAGAQLRSTESPREASPPTAIIAHDPVNELPK
jgi:hypothetical protein